LILESTQKSTPYPDTRKNLRDLGVPELVRVLRSFCMVGGAGKKSEGQR
jgi:hypothetical protein